MSKCVNVLCHLIAFYLCTCWQEDKVKADMEKAFGKWKKFEKFTGGKLKGWEEVEEGDKREEQKSEEEREETKAVPLAEELVDTMFPCTMAMCGSAFAIMRVSTLCSRTGMYEAIVYKFYQRF